MVIKCYLWDFAGVQRGIKCVLRHQQIKSQQIKEKIYVVENKKN